MRSPISGLLSSRNSYCSPTADRTTFAEVPAGFSVGTTTAWRYVNETVALLAARPTKLRKAVRGTEKADYAYVVLDGPVLPPWPIDVL
jgi:hypothetical protein